MSVADWFFLSNIWIKSVECGSRNFFFRLSKKIDRYFLIMCLIWCVIGSIWSSLKMRKKTKPDRHSCVCLCIVIRIFHQSNFKFWPQTIYIGIRVTHQQTQGTQNLKQWEKKLEKKIQNFIIHQCGLPCDHNDGWYSALTNTSNDIHRCVCDEKFFFFKNLQKWNLTKKKNDTWCDFLCVCVRMTIFSLIFTRDE